MIASLHIHGYRGFERFDMSQLGRVNLLVGKNNSGKTSVLEALHLLTARGDPTALWQLLWRRGERFPIDRDPRRPQPEADISHLFTGHELRLGSEFTITARNQRPEHSLTFTVSELSPKEQAELFGPEDVPVPARRLAIQVTGKPAPGTTTLPLTLLGGISPDLLSTPHALRRRMSNPTPVQYIATESLSGDDLVRLWNSISLSPTEDLVLQALQFLDHDVERIAAQAGGQAYYGAMPTRGGFIVKRKGYDQPIPLGSMGDGMWRMLTMAIAITQSKGGVLLVDEIDTGLHYTAMAEMWKLIFGAAKQFDVQVFATTHSYDCVHSLATLCMADSDAQNRLTIQRIEAGKRNAIPYDENEIKLAAERQIEVR